MHGYSGARRGLLLTIDIRWLRRTNSLTGHESRLAAPLPGSALLQQCGHCDQGEISKEDWKVEEQMKEPGMESMLCQILLVQVVAQVVPHGECQRSLVRELVPVLWMRDQDVA